MLPLRACFSGAKYSRSMCIHERKAIERLKISPVTIQIKDRYGVAPRLVMSAPGVTKKSVMIDGWKTVRS